MKMCQIVMRGLLLVFASCFTACSDNDSTKVTKGNAVPKEQESFTHEEWERKETNDGLLKREMSYFQFKNYGIPAGGYVSRVYVDTKDMKIDDAAQYHLGIQCSDGKSGMNEWYVEITKNDKKGYFKADKIHLRTSEAMKCSTEYLKETIEPSIKVKYEDDFNSKSIRFTSARKDSSKMASVDVRDLFDSGEDFMSVKKMSFGVKTLSGELSLKFDARCVAELMSELESIAKRHNDTIKFWAKTDDEISDIMEDAIKSALNKKKDDDLK